MSHDGYAVHHVPTLSERMWRKLGFRYHLGEEPEGFEKLEGWMCTRCCMDFSILDRLRLLLTGRLHIQLTQYTPVQCDYSKNRLDWEIKHIGAK